MITVYHKVQPSFCQSPSDTTLRPEDFTCVARVDTAYLDEAFALTNSVEGPWWKNEKVQVQFKGDACRSTSIGDVLVDASNRKWEVGITDFIAKVSRLDETR